MGSVVDIRGNTNLCVPAPLLCVVLTYAHFLRRSVVHGVIGDALLQRS